VLTVCILSKYTAFSLTLFAVSGPVSWFLSLDSTEALLCTFPLTITNASYFIDISCGHNLPHILKGNCFAWRVSFICWTEFTSERQLPIPFWFFLHSPYSRTLLNNSRWFLEKRREQSTLSEHSTSSQIEVSSMLRTSS
jgi:hypothetical protein